LLNIEWVKGRLHLLYISPGITGNTQLIGMGNSNDGIFYGYNGSTWLRRYNHRYMDFTK
jgi:hypothetical protein